MRKPGKEGKLSVKYAHETPRKFNGEWFPAERNLRNNEKLQKCAYV